MWIRCTQGIQNALVDNLTREADIAGRNHAGSWTHQCTAPMGWRTREMRHLMSSKPQQMVCWCFACFGKHKRAPSEQGTQEDLQASIAPDIVERSPDNIGTRVRSADWRSKCRQSMRDHLGHATRAGSE